MLLLESTAMPFHSVLVVVEGNPVEGILLYGLRWIQATSRRSSGRRTTSPSSIFRATLAILNPVE